ncbi:MAG: ABC transporter substrate-binding protein [Clostridia bacterium]|nr:ABC transporter substrate-binding protein [Clostridia bacterium]
MKKFLSLILSLVVMLSVFFGCGKSESDGITVYYIDGCSQLTRAMDNYENNTGIKLNKVAFENSEDIQAKINTDEADVYLLRNGYTDIQKLMASGKLEPLNGYINNDESFNAENYFNGVMDCGIYSGENYILPFGFTLNSFYTTDGRLADYNAELSTESSLTDIMSEISKDIYENADNMNVSVTSVTYDAGKFASFYRVSGIDYIDTNNKTVNLNTPEFKAVADFCKALYKNAEKLTEIQSQLDSESVEDYTNNIGYFIGNNVNPMLYIYFQTIVTGYGGSNELNNVKALPLPMYNNSGKYCIDIDTFGAISSSSEYKNECYELLRTAMDTEGCLLEDSAANKVNSPVSVNKNSAKEVIDICLNDTNDSQFKLDNGKTVATAKYTQDFANETTDVYDNIEKAVLSNYSADNILSEVMIKYYRDEEDFNSCITELENKLTIYLNE